MTVVSPTCRTSRRVRSLGPVALALTLAGCVPMAEAPAPVDAGPIVTDGGRDLPFVPGTCPIDTRCGGELQGTWRFLSGCVLGEDDPIVTWCAFAAFELRLLPSGTLELGLDNQYTLELSLRTEGDLGIPPACREGMPALSAAECASFGRGVTSHHQCRRDDQGGCHCRYWTQTPLVQRESGVYFAEGGQLLLGDVLHTYCVRGGRLYIRGPVQDGQAAVFTLAR